MSAAMLRQATYGSLRVGLYGSFKKKWETDNGRKAGVKEKVLAGVLSGGLSAALCNPADLIKV